MIDVGLVNLLAGNAGAAALLGAGGASSQPGYTPQASIFGDVVPEDVTQYPCIAYQFVGGRSDPTLTTSGAQCSRVQIDCWAVNRLVAKQLANAVRQCLNGYSGVLSDGTRLMTADLIHPGIDFFSDDSRFFRRMLEFYLLYNFTD